MSDDTGVTERRRLVVSMILTGGLGALGVVWGIASGSQMILLDGVYGLVGIVLSALLIAASSLADRGPTRRFPFGMEAATPLAIAIQAFVLLATLLYAAVEAGYTIRGGGSEVTAGPAIAYGTIVTVACVVVALYLRRHTGHSDVVRSEATAWWVAALRGVGMVVGFAVLAVLDGSRWSEAAPYVDPVMVLVSCLALLSTPLRMLKGTLVELLDGAPPSSTGDRVHAIVRAVQAEFDLDEPRVYLSKVGPKLYLDLTVTAGPQVTIAQEHAVRESLRRRLGELPYEVWLSVELLPRGYPGVEAV